MKWLRAAAIAAAVCGLSTATMAAASLPFKPMYKVVPTTGHINLPGTSTASPLPSFAYTFTDPLSGTKYSGHILGSKPQSLTATTISVQIVPLKVTLNDGTTTVTYSPTDPDPCNNNIPSVVYVAHSPLFQSTHLWRLNGVNVGRTQYIDAFQRAQFWHVVRGSNYHLTFNRTELPQQQLAFGPNALTANQNGGILCGYAGYTNMGAVDAAVRAIMSGPLQSSINVGTLPVFLLHNVFMTEDTGGCCVLGYHDSLMVNGKLQVYAVADVDSTGFFHSSGDDDIVTLSHELAEAVNDPTGGNAVPPWNNGSFCQPNLEVGDPVGGHELPPIQLDGSTYHVQELAYSSWFYHRPSGGAGLLYSDNGTFTTYAPQCT
jgi:hypothetical protein